MAELENLMESSGQSPKAQWRTRTLIRSAQEADRDIYKRLYEYDIEYHYSQSFLLSGDNKRNKLDGWMLFGFHLLGSILISISCYS